MTALWLWRDRRRLVVVYAVLTVWGVSGAVSLLARSGLPLH